MMYVEIKRKYAHLIVLIIIVLGFSWLYTGIQPRTTGDNWAWKNINIVNQ